SNLAVNIGIWRNGTVTDLFQCQFCPPFGINNSGQFVGQVQTHFPRYAYLYKGGTLYNLNDLIPPGSGWVLTGAAAVNDVGQIIGVGTLNGEDRAFRLDPLTTAPPTITSQITGTL